MQLQRMIYSSLIKDPSEKFKTAVFWDIAPRSLLEVYRRFRYAYCLNLQGDGHFQFGFTN
jgi:hypothetical protein